MGIASGPKNGTGGWDRVLDDWPQIFRHLEDKFWWPWPWPQSRLASVLASKRPGLSLKPWSRGDLFYTVF